VRRTDAVEFCEPKLRLRKWFGFFRLAAFTGIGTRPRGVASVARARYRRGEERRRQPGVVAPVYVIDSKWITNLIFANCRVRQQLREGVSAPRPLTRYAILNRDAKFSAEVLSLLRSSGIEPMRTAIRSSLAERQGGTLGWKLPKRMLRPMSSRSTRRMYAELPVNILGTTTTTEHILDLVRTRRSKGLLRRSGTFAELISLPRMGGIHHRYVWINRCLVGAAIGEARATTGDFV